ncbi:hypothetical protein ESP57_17850 [Agromyces fucosus]|uniref:LuxR family transcriptional regulator n=1 Tax=Agromyces fucosus TaxID=41985 RepID=A0A4Q2JKQ6_9MICO|nr:MULTISPECIES: hypothetical protein [Agromyces]KQZ07700.1 hypothetical protein ASD23_18010 [Agromyces sp. Root1464]RXZ46727.1 hypothetical protein ESP57_17850 [Agromyces fucosus]
MEDRALLELIYRSRPETVAELAITAHADEGETAAAVARLARTGAISAHDGTIAWATPARWTADVVGREARLMRQSADEAASRIEALVADLPTLLRHWAVGEASGDIVPVFVRHGPQAAEDLWFDIAREQSESAWSVLPDLGRYLQTDPARAGRFAEMFAGKRSVRAILPRSMAGDARLVAIAERYAAVGVEFRLLDDLPSWFWIDGEVLAFPIEWGEGWPSSVVGVRSAALAELGRCLFRELWRRGEPIGGTQQPWGPLLALMKQGVTLDAASRRLGINPRTGRRRIAAAMEQYGVSTLFALGAAWAADGESTAR